MGGVGFDCNHFNFPRYMTFSKRLVYHCLLFICVFDFLRNLNWFFVSKFNWKVKYCYYQPTRLKKCVRKLSNKSYSVAAKYL